jgi:hypothetical protein
VLEPASLQHSVGLVSAMALKLAGDPRWDNDAGLKAFLAFRPQWNPAGNPLDSSVVLGCVSAQMIELILENCGDDLPRENLLKQATKTKNHPFSLLWPGVMVTVKSDNYATFSTFRTARFDAKRRAIFGEPINAGAK